MIHRAAPLSNLLACCRDVGFNFLRRYSSRNATAHALEQVVQLLTPGSIVGNPLCQIRVDGPPHEISHTLMLLCRQVFEHAQLIFIKVDVGSLHGSDIPSHAALYIMVYIPADHGQQLIARHAIIAASMREERPSAGTAPAEPLIGEIL